MKKPLLYSLFKLGKFPNNMDLSSVKLKDEGIKIRIFFKDFNGPSKRYKQKTKIVLGSIIFTNNRLLAFSYNQPLVDLMLNDKKMSEIKFSSESENSFSICFDASTFDSESKGEITYTFYTEIANEIINNLDC